MSGHQPTCSEPCCLFKQQLAAHFCGSVMKCVCPRDTALHLAHATQGSLPTPCAHACA